MMDMKENEKREKVIKGFELCLTPTDRREYKDADVCHAECPYFRAYKMGDCIRALSKDALALLKAQEPVRPKWRNGYAYCGQCGYKLHWIVERNNFCANCGHGVKWE